MRWILSDSSLLEMIFLKFCFTRRRLQMFLNCYWVLFNFSIRRIKIYYSEFERKLISMIVIGGVWVKQTNWTPLLHPVNGWTVIYLSYTFTEYVKALSYTADRLCLLPNCVCFDYTALRFIWYKLWGHQTTTLYL